MIKTFLKLNIIFLLLSTLAHPAYSQETENELLSEKLNSIGFNKILAVDPQQEIKNFFEKNAKYSNSHNLEKLKNLYADNYMSSDGFDKETYFNMIKRTWETYPSVNYYVEIKDIDLNEEYATVYLNECASGSTKESYENIKENGQIYSKAYTVYHLQKFGRNWKITSSTIIQENTALCYGDARNLNINLNAPTQVKAGESYTATMNIDVPSSTFIIASLSNEPIVYPQGQPKDVFRNVKRNGVLERVFTANKDGRNEFAVASVGITKAAVVDSQSISINVTGMAFVMTRVNVLNVKNQNVNEASSLADGKN